MGKKVDQLKGGIFTFAGDKVTMKMGDKQHAGSYKADASKSPKHIDITSKGPGGKENTAEAIYKIDGETLTICTGLGTASSTKNSDGTETEPVAKQDPRPTAFDSKQGALIVFKRKSS